MKKQTKIYFAIFEPTGTGYGIYFPDFPGCISVGEDLSEAMDMAKEALELHYNSMAEDGDPIPLPTMPPFTNLDEGEFAVPIEISMHPTETKPVRKTVTIPAWLNNAAENAHINFSSFVQHALKVELDLQ